MDWQAFWLTVRLAVLVAALLAGLGIADCLLDHLFALALEISRRGRSRAAHRIAADRAGFLCAAGAGTAQSAGAGMASTYPDTLSRLPLTAL